MVRDVPSGSGGLLAAGERLRPEDQPRELFADHPQLVFRADSLRRGSFKTMLENKRYVIPAEGWRKTS